MNSEQNSNIEKCVQLEFCSSGRWNNANSYLYIFLWLPFRLPHKYTSVGLEMDFLAPFVRLHKKEEKKFNQKREILRNGHFIKLKIKKNLLRNIGSECVGLSRFKNE